MTSDTPHGDLRSFGRRRGRKPTSRQAALLRDVLPRFAVDALFPLARRCPVGADEGAVTLAPGGRLAERQSPGAIETWLEIGFGGGEHLLWQAERHPAVSFIGCEPFEDGVIKLLDAIEHQRLTNIRVHMGDARDVLRALPNACLSRAFILFPDPWPKRKQAKRRLVNATTLDLLARAMRPGALLRLGTDIGDYARTTLEAMHREPRFMWLAESPADWRVRPLDWPETRYEAKAAAAGRQRYYFSFRRC